jgi:hypothetical protein
VTTVAEPEAETRPWWKRVEPGTWLLFGLIALLSFPLLIAIGVLHSPRWYPLLDMAQTELRVRDITSSHPPAIGLAGRIGPYGPGGGSHPGPLSFYALWPVYQLFGSTAWALQLATFVLDICAIGLTLWLAKRRGGVVLMCAMALMLAVLTNAYGAFLLTLPWNPYLPVLWWVVFLVSVWSVLLDDYVALPVAVFAGSLCAQTHIPYLGLVGGLVLAVSVLLIVRIARRAGDEKRAVLRWSLVALGFGTVLWLPPVIEEIVHDPGNITVIKDHFSDPPEEEPVVGIPDGVEDFLSQLNPWRLVSETLVEDARARPVDGSVIPGALLVLAWGGAAALSYRMRHRALLALHATLAGALALGVISAARIFGYVWYYLLLWAWGIAALLLVAIGWTLVAWFTRSSGAEQRSSASRVGKAVLLGATALSTVAFTLDATTVTVQAPARNASLGALTGPTVEALEERDDSGPLLVTWLPDPGGIGEQGFGLLNELLREGYDARAREAHTPGATRYHTAEPDEVGREVHLATGHEVDVWRDNPNYEEIATFVPSAEAQAEFEELRKELVASLRAAGNDARADRIDADLFMMGVDPVVDENSRQIIAKMLELERPAAVFIGPPSGSV